MNLRQAMGVESLQLDLHAVQTALAGEQPPAQTGLVAGDAHEAQEIHWENLSLHEAISDTAGIADEVSDLIGVQDQAVAVVGSVENLMGYGLEREGLVLALESVLGASQMEGLFLKHFGGLGLESEGGFEQLSDEQLAVALEGIVGDLWKGIENIGVSVTKRFGDWWHYEANTLSKLSGEAEKLLYQVKGLHGKQPVKASIRVTDLHALQFDGKVDSKSILKGFQNLQATQVKLNDESILHFRKFVKEILQVYKETASGFDVAANRVELALRMISLVATLSTLVTFNPVLGAIVSLSTQALAAIVPKMISTVGDYKNTKRGVDLENVDRKVLRVFEDFLKGIQSSTLADGMSGDRYLKLGMDKKSNRVVKFGIERTVALRQDAKQGVETPDIATIESILKAIVSGADQFKHRNFAYEEAITEYYSVLSEILAGSTATETHGIQRGMSSFTHLVDELFIEPTIALGKIQASTARSLLDYCERAIKAYA